MVNPFHNIAKNMWDVLWSQSVSSLKLIVGFGYILGYFSMSNIVGCSFDLQLWASKFGFHVTELETEVFFVIF